MTSEALFEAMRRSIIDGDDERAAELAGEALRAGVDPLRAIDDGFVIGLREVGDRFSRGDMFLPEMMLAAKAMKRAVAVLEPELDRRAMKRQVLGRVVIGSVKGDIHEIGKNLVATMLAAAGFEVHDLGVDVPFDRFVEKAREVDADIVGVSALLTTTMTGQRTVIETLAAGGLRPRVKVIVGGAPVTREWAEEIGADGYGEDAAQAVTVARRLVGAADAAVV
ncbi:MAG: methyltransferase [Chloroflexi bacterium GWC2_73_18]|nr:MAG: methyltransferase [Chloroflexi bacterium GWC2_73_18]